jgi:hypothetical protein
MRHVGTVIGSAIAGILVFSMWGALAKAYGLMGGWLAAMVTISIAWGVNHFSGVIYNHEEGCWVDMALGIGVAGTTMGMFQGLSVINALPTLVTSGIGGALGGALAALVSKAISAKEE